MSVGSTPAVIGYGVLASVVLSAFDFTGAKMTGYDKDPSVDDYARKQELRKNRRRPIEETIRELGEGRGIVDAVSEWTCTNHDIGIVAPGYSERRAARIKEAYGIDVPAN